MVATIAQASQAEFYLERQRSYRHPNEYVRGGEGPDGVWWNPSGLFGLEVGGRIDSRDFLRLHEVAPRQVFSLIPIVVRRCPEWSGDGSFGDRCAAS